MLNNKKAETNILGIIISVFTIALFFGFASYMISNLGGDTTGFDSGELDKYNSMTNLSNDLNIQANTLENTVVDPGVFDFFAGIFDQVLRPFKFAYGSYKTVRGMVTYIQTDLNLPAIFTEYFYAIITTIVLIGIVMIKFYMNRNKGGN